MGIATDLYTLLRGSSASGFKTQLQGSPGGGLYNNPEQAAYTELTRNGGMWGTFSAASTPLVVYPSTLTILEVYNNSLITGTPFVMEIVDLFGFHLLGTAALHSVSLWAQVTAPKAAPSTASYVIGSMSGRGVYTSTAGTKVGTGAGTTVVASAWRPFGASAAHISTATPDEAFSAPVDGKLLVPPGCSVCVTATDTLATGSSVQVGVVWNERVMTMVNAIA